MKSSIKLLIGFLSVVVLLGGFFAYRQYAARVIKNDGRVTGNTASNLYGGGYFCQYGNKVYFSNPSDGGALYVMDLDESNPKKLISDKVYCINTDGNYIYYCRNNYAQESAMSFLKGNRNSLCRCTMDGKDVTVLDEALCTNAVLCGNTIYYNRYDKGTATTLYSIGIDKSDKKMVSGDPIDPRGAYNASIYFAGVVSDHFLHRINGGSDSVVYSGTVWQPVVTSANTVYSLDLDNGYRVCSINISDNTKQTLTPYGAACFAVNNNFIIYQSIKAEEDGIYMYNMIDGTNKLLLSGQYKNINLTDRYFYFSDYNSGVFYHGSYAGTVSMFTAY